MNKDKIKSKNGIKEAILSEYNVLRDEISTYHNERNNFINYSVILTAAILGSIATPVFDKYPLILLILPIIYFIIGSHYLDRTLRIIRIADYIHNSLRPKLCNIVNDEIWQWELYKRHTKRINKQIARFFDWLRGWAFIFPGGICVIYFLFIIKKNIFKLALLEYTIFLLDIFLIILLIYFTIKLEETSGAIDQKINMEKK